ncbi:MAG TPA: HAD family phosphatase [Alphaproteobacteria bacterium]|nr:HAD family phosphatase [Alphaproteobacteria bacterium]
MTAQPLVPVFDIGGVFLDWNPRHLYRKLFEDEAAMEHFLETVCSPDWNLQQDAGRSWAEAVAELTERFPDHAEMIGYYDTRWEEMIPRIFHGTVGILEELQARGPVYAITNFSVEKFAHAKTLWPFLASFDGCVVSGECRLLKPDAAIYRRLCDEYGLAPERCLFIDDVQKNVEGARAVGMQAVRFESPEQLRADLVVRGMLD